jgi:hypothetical protein
LTLHARELSSQPLDYNKFYKENKSRIFPMGKLHALSSNPQIAMNTIYTVSYAPQGELCTIDIDVIMLD